MGPMGKLAAAGLGGLAAIGFAPAERAAASPLNKTYDFTYSICGPDGTGCTKWVHVHDYISGSGNVFGFQDAVSGHKRALGEVFGSNGTQARFSVEGDALVFNAAASQVSLRIVITTIGSRCTMSGSATSEGSPFPIQLRSGPCRVYAGHKSF